MKVVGIVKIVLVVIRTFDIIGSSQVMGKRVLILFMLLSELD